MRFSPALMSLAAGCGVAFLSPCAAADVLLDATSIFPAATAPAPAEYAFTATAAEALTVTLTDFKIPAAFSDLEIAVTLGDVLVGTAKVDATFTAKVTIPAAAGNYGLHVIGTPDATQGWGSFGVTTTRDADGTTIAADSFSGNIQVPATPNTGTTQFTNNFTPATTGNYTVTLTDDAFPGTLQMLSALVIGGGSQVVIPGGTLASPAPTLVPLTAGTNYQLFAAATPTSALPAGLFSIHVTDPSGATVYDRTVPVGQMGASTVINNAKSQTANLSLVDQGYPAPLASAGIAVTSGGTALGVLTAPGTVSNIVLPAGQLEVWNYAAAGAQPGVYTVGLTGVTTGATPPSLLSSTQVVNPSPASSATSFAFVATIPSAGSYNLLVSDFLFPAALQTLAATVAQNGVALTQDSSGNFTAQAGVVVVVVNAATGGNGIFGVTVGTTGSSPTVLLDSTQAVGSAFVTSTLNVATSGAYDVTLGDLGFPAAFQNLAVVVSRGSRIFGKIFAAGTFNISNATPGQYEITFVATPGASHYGLYSLRVASSVPTVTLTSSASSVTAGQPVTLTWSSQGTTSCMADGASGWSGTEPASGSASVTIAATVALKLSCTGPGGTASQSVNVTAVAVPTKSGGRGGGVVDWNALAVLGGMVWLRWCYFRGPRTHHRRA
jgi:hypothetical protein